MTRDELDEILMNTTPVPPDASTSASSPATTVPVTWAPRRWPAFLTIAPQPRTPLADRPGRYLASVLRDAWLPLLVGAVLTALTYLSSGLIPTVLGRVVDHGMSHGLSAQLVPGLIALAALGVAGGLVGGVTELFAFGSWVSGWQPSVRGVGYRLGLRSRAVTREVSSGDVVSTATSDADSIGALMYFIVTVIGSLISTVVVAILMLRMDTGLGLLVLLGLPVVLLGVGTLLRPLNRRMSVQREEQGRLTTVTTDVVAGLRVLRGIGGEDVYAAR